MFTITYFKNTFTTKQKLQFIHVSFQNDPPIHTQHGRDDYMFMMNSEEIVCNMSLQDLISVEDLSGNLNLIESYKTLNTSLDRTYDGLL